MKREELMTRVLLQPGRAALFAMARRVRSLRKCSRYPARTQSPLAFFPAPASASVMVGFFCVLVALGGCCAGVDETGDVSTTPAFPSDSRTKKAGTQKGGGVFCWSAPQDDKIGSLGFSDSTLSLGLMESLRGMRAHAAAVGDVNGDGWVDLFVGTFADVSRKASLQQGKKEQTSDRLLLGGPEGFVVDASFAPSLGRTSGAVFADLDGDTDLDLVLARNKHPHPELAEEFPQTVLVFQNESGSFTQAAEILPNLGARGIGVADFYEDGLLDLFVVEDGINNPGRSVLLKNQGDFSFVDMTASAGLPSDLTGFAVSTADLNQDLRPDLFVAGSNRLFLNRGDGSFREGKSSVFRWPSAGTEDIATGVAVADLTKDGLPEIFIGQHYGSSLEDGQAVPARLYLHEGTGADGLPTFREITTEAGLVGFETKAPHVEIADLDADGWPDLVLSVSAGKGELPTVFRHKGMRRGIPYFAQPEGLGASQYWVTGVVFDVNRDGRLDIFQTEWAPALPSRLWQNTTDIGHWLAVGIAAMDAKQQGNAGALQVGALVEVYEEGGMGDATRLLGSRSVTLEVGYAAGGSGSVYFGLGEVEKVDLRILAPGRKPLQFRAVEADQYFLFPGGCSGQT